MNYLKVPDPYRDISAVVKVQVLAVVVWTQFLHSQQKIFMTL